MILSNIINVETHTATAKFILFAILERAEYEKRNTILMTQVYIAKLCSCTKQGVNKELKYLQEQGYITYKRALFKNLTTTEITLTEKSIALISSTQETQIKPQNKTIKTEETQPQVDASKTSNKPQNKPINTEPRQPQAEAEKAPQTAPKQVETEEQAFQTEIEKMNAMYRSLNNIQKGCATALKRAKTDNPVYIREAQERGVPQVLIDFILKYNKMKREERNYENV